jgi:uncharacterized LabA/DUF88 family protein
LADNNQDEQRLALFIDFENIAIGVRDAHYRKFNVNLVLERLLDKGKLLAKKAYADWSRYSDYKRSFHEAAIELIEVPQKSVGGKNSADIRLVVDAMDMSFQKEHINCFVVASGDSDFSPLVSKLKENNKYVIGVGVKDSTSDLLSENCDEFIFYEDLVRGQQSPHPRIANVPEKLQECFALLVDSVVALQRENKEILWGSMVKETMKRKKPSFNESYYGFRTFSHLLEDAQRRGIVSVRRDNRSGSYIIEDLGAASIAPSSRSESDGAQADASTDTNEGRPSRRRRSRGRRSRGATAATGTAEAGDEGDEGDDGEENGHEENGREEATAGPSHGSASQPAEPDGDAAQASTGSGPSGQAPTERPIFSFLSWIRRETTAPRSDESAEKPAAEPTKDEES